ncbi:MAG: carboxypeptidase M32 [Parachlamydiales bacterium]
MTAYQQLESHFKRLNSLRGAAGILHWDHAVMMPPGAASARGEQLATLDLLAHQMASDPHVGDLLDRAERDTSSLDEWERANLYHMRRLYKEANAIPEELVEVKARAAVASEVCWRVARETSDFASWAPHLEEIVKIVREIAAAKGEALALSPYDALLEAFDPGMRVSTIDRIFGELSGVLPGLIQAAIDKQGSRKLLPLEGPFPIDKQRSLALALMKQIGFDFNRGRLDVSAHPFCGGGLDDIRITTKYTESDFASALMGVLHETGHAMYEFGLPEEWAWQPVGDALGMTLHESQSLLFEMQVCRSPEFLGYVAPLIQSAFNGKGPAWEGDNLYHHYTRVERGFIRIDADEVTYPAHVILRYRLERRLIDGTLSVRELPEAWSDELESLLGIRPPDHKRGCMQDIHWSDGSFGYFPVYTLGALLAAQLFEAAKATVPHLLEEVQRGNFVPLFTWLRDQVHGHGSRLSSEELTKRATGRPLGIGSWTAHIKKRYL